MGAFLSSEAFYVLVAGVALSIATGAGGFVIKAVWDSWHDAKMKQQDRYLNTLLNSQAEALQNFYWPIYIRLATNVVSWKLATDKQTFSATLEREIILPKHLEIVKIIESFIHLVKPDSEFNEQILLYIKYVSLYQSIRASGDATHFPTDYECEFPSKFVKMIEDYTLSTQADFNKLNGLQFDKKGHQSKDLQKIFKDQYKHIHHNQPEPPVRMWWQEMFAHPTGQEDIEMPPVRKNSIIDSVPNPFFNPKESLSTSTSTESGPIQEHQRSFKQVYTTNSILPL